MRLVLINLSAYTDLKIISLNNFTLFVHLCTHEHVLLVIKVNFTLQTVVAEGASIVLAIA